METRNTIMTFDSAEHKKLGELQLPGLPKTHQTLLMPNGVELSFGEILALAGDYFAKAKKPISLGENEREQQKRFLAAYATLAYSKRKKIRKILGIIKGQTQSIERAMAQGKPEYVGVNRYKFKEILKALLYTKFKVVSIYEMGLDHMNDNAIIAHRAGHTLAVEAAARAYYINDPQQKYAELAYAYSLEAFACHFLTDHFASGHLRTPSSALNFEFGPSIGSLLTTLMHHEDGQMGLNVANENGDIWKAYGDAYLFESYNKKTKDLAIQALKIVINEVYEAFNTGRIPTNQYSKAYNLLPQAIQDNFSPMFVNDARDIQILYRSKLGDLNCQEYKKLTQVKIPYLLAHLFVRCIKKNVLDEHKGQKTSSSLKKFSLFSSHKKHHGVTCKNIETNRNRLRAF